MKACFRLHTQPLSVTALVPQQEWMIALSTSAPLSL
jgi:hypothetical protein